MAKEKKYFPLETIDMLNWQFPLYDGVKFPTFSEAKELCIKRDEETLHKVLNKYPAFARGIEYSVERNKKMYGQGMKHAVNEMINDLWSVVALHYWSQNKQVFKFDKDFVDELIKTEEIKLYEGIFDHLPFEYFIIDFSDNKTVRDEIKGDALLIHVYKKPRSDNKEYYYIELIKMDYERGYIYRDTLWFPNEDYIEKYEEWVEEGVVFDEAKKASFKEATNRGIYRLLVVQALTYLASSERDIKENETTQRTYRKPDPNFIKNKFSEVRIQDVGMRFGSAVRSWYKTKQMEENTSAAENIKNGSHSAHRPHFRRAHWHTYCYGKNHSERKVVWQHEMAINMSFGKDAGVVVHKAKKGDVDEER